MRNYGKTIKKEYIKENLTIFLWFSVAFIIALIIAVSFRTITVKGKAMEPGLKNDDCILIRSVSVIGKPPEYGDLVFLRCNVASEEGYSGMIRRVVGLPGDRIEISNGVVYRNGAMLKENYIKESPEKYNMESIIIDQNRIFVMCDNRNYDYDSRNSDLGTVAYEDIMGIVAFRLFPLKE